MLASFREPLLLTLVGGVGGTFSQLSPSANESTLARGPRKSILLTALGESQLKRRRTRVRFPASPRKMHWIERSAALLSLASTFVLASLARLASHLYPAHFKAALGAVFSWRFARVWRRASPLFCPGAIAPDPVWGLHPQPSASLARLVSHLYPAHFKSRHRGGFFHGDLRRL